MKRPSVAAAAFALTMILAGGAAEAQTILFTFAGLRGSVDTCKWFDDNLNSDRSVDTLTRQTDLLYDSLALPVGASVTAGATAVTAEGEQLVDFKLNSGVVCTAAEALYGPTPTPSMSPTPLPT
jgi:hypothetical protein